MTDTRTIIHNGLWHNNPALVQVLGLCPLLAVSNSAVHGLALGLATLVVLIASNTLIAALRHQISNVIRLPALVMLIAVLVSVIDLLMNAWWHSLYLSLGIFVPLIASNCLLLGRALNFASQHSVAKSALDGLMQGLGALWVLFVLGSARELFGHGTWMQDAEQLFGSKGAALSLQVLSLDNDFLLAVLAPGAFIGLGFLIAMKNAIDAHHKTSKRKKMLIERLEPEAL